MTADRPSFFRRLIAAGTLVLFSVVHVFAHDGVKHETTEEAINHIQNSANTPGFPDIKGGDFDLIDHNGEARTSKNPNGQYQLVFFGYASCKAICSVALPRMANAIDKLADQKVDVTPVLITVDPERDTVETMKEAVGFIHPNMVGLTGSEKALEIAYKAFQIEKSLVYVHPEEGPVYAHGSFIYLLDGEGQFKTLLPPVLTPERMAEVAMKYISGAN